MKTYKKPSIIVESFDIEETIANESSASIGGSTSPWWDLLNQANEENQ